VIELLWGAVPQCETVTFLLGYVDDGKNVLLEDDLITDDSLEFDIS